MRSFETGATRDTDANKLDFEGFFSPLVLEVRARYMNKNRVQADGNVRDSDNWQKGMPLEVYMKSGFRHFFAWWKEHRDLLMGVEALQQDDADIERVIEDICGLMFNAEGYLHELLTTGAEYDPEPVYRLVSDGMGGTDVERG